VKSAEKSREPPKAAATQKSQPKENNILICSQRLSMAKKQNSALSALKPCQRKPNKIKD